MFLQQNTNNLLARNFFKSASVWKAYLYTLKAVPSAINFKLFQSPRLKMAGSATRQCGAANGGSLASFCSVENSEVLTSTTTVY